LIVVILAASGITVRADNLLYDRLQGARAPLPSDQIIVVAIDNRSLQALGKWPWPRKIHAQLLTQLARAQPKAIAYDVLFPEPSAEDGALALAMRQAAPVYLPLLIDNSGVNGSGVSAVLPVPVLAQAAAGIGEVNVHSDGDSLVRRADPSMTINRRIWPHLMTLLTPAAQRPTHIFPIAYQPTVSAFRTASFIDVYNGQLPDVFLRDKIVLVGATGDGMGDQFAVPIRFGGKMTGIDLQANMLNTMLVGLPITPLPRWADVLLALIPIWVLLVSLWRWRPGALLVISLLLLLSCIAASVALFLTLGWWWPPTPALVGLAFVYPLWGWRRLAALSNTVESETTAFNAATQMGDTIIGAGPADQVERQRLALQSAFASGRAVAANAREREQALQMLSHDMRAPQASIITLLETDAKDLSPAFKSRVAGYARRTLALADNFVQLARVQESVFRPEELNLSDVVNEAIDELYPLYSARHIHVTAEGIDEPHYIMGEPALLVRVIINVIDNAIKYSPDNSTIACSLIYDGHDVRCVIADQGSGMSDAQIAALFQRFSPIGTERNTGSAGSGLGLALVKSAVERHGGKISCTSAIGAGTAFTLSFPAIL
jgi:CHASE2 domain-containing sensor protein/two-component sensor histidine kinase